MNCRHCSTQLEYTFLDLGFAPPSNAYLNFGDLAKPEKYYPLKVKVCVNCWLVQTEDYAKAEELFNADYAYFSSTSSGWLAHAESFSQDIIKRLDLNQSSYVIEVASNDGYLLKNFLAAGIPCLGVEPTDCTALACEKLGIEVLREFFSEALAKRLAGHQLQADLIIGNNVFAHVPEINDFTRGLKTILKVGGTITLEFPHIMRLIENNQFDTIYHEHFSYLSLYTVNRIFRNSGLRIFNVEELTTHGGSLRIYGCHTEDERETNPSVDMMLAVEAKRGLQNLITYQLFQANANRVKDDLLTFLLRTKFSGKTVAAYGAAAKGNTLLNYAGIKPDLLPFVCDASIAKQGKFMPGSHIPILSPSELIKQRPDYLLILPWNIAFEIKHIHAELAKSGTKFVTAVPNINVI